jgi:hypothetical protein
MRMRASVASAEVAEKAAADALILQLLTFVAEGARSYAETMEAWRSTCPRMPIWEDAVRDGLVRVESGSAMAVSRVVLTPRGKATLAAQRHGGMNEPAGKPHPQRAQPDQISGHQYLGVRSRS